MFMLSRKTDSDRKPVRFVEIDEEMCAHFGVAVHETSYYCGWYDWIGDRIAVGQSFEKMREDIRAVTTLSAADLQRTLEIIDFLDARFTTDAWYMPKAAR
jgi:hypothetical protein